MKQFIAYTILTISAIILVITVGWIMWTNWLPVLVTVGLVAMVFGIPASIMWAHDQVWDQYGHLRSKRNGNQ